MTDDHSFFKLIYILKKLTDNWGDSHLQTIIPEFKMSYMPVFICVSQGITSNVAIATELHITKMAVSKMISGLTQLNLISTDRDSSDGRSVKLSLTAEGKIFLTNVLRVSSDLENDYKKIIGKAEYNKLLSSLDGIKNFHEKQLV